MIRNRSNLILLFYYKCIPNFYNTNKTLLCIVKRRYLWLRLHRILWLFIWRIFFIWLKMLHLIKVVTIWFILNTYSRVNYNYIYFYVTNQYLLIYTPYLMLFLHSNYINIFLLPRGINYFLIIIANNLNWIDLNYNLFNGFIVLKFLRNNPFILTSFIFHPWHYNLNLNNLLVLWVIKQHFSYQTSLIPATLIQGKSTATLYFFISLRFLVLIYQYCIYLYYFIIL